jgi:hypothetical protein
MTGAERLRNEGFRDGYIESLVLTAVASLREGLDVGLISRITGLSPDKIRSLENALGAVPAKK